MRLLIPTLLLATATATQAADVTERVDLNAPGAFESLRSTRPAHYEKARAILQDAGTHPTAPTTRPLLEARFDATDIEMLQWRVSFPPKLQVSFTLDATRYTAEVTPNLPPARATPAR